MLDQGLSLNINSLVVLNEVGVSRENITRQTIEVSGSEGGRKYTMGFINLNLIVGRTRAAYQFHVIDAKTNHLPDQFGEQISL